MIALVILLIRGVQRAKCNGTYLQPDNLEDLADYSGLKDKSKSMTTTNHNDDIVHTEQAI